MTSTFNIDNTVIDPDINDAEEGSGYRDLDVRPDDLLGIDEDSCLRPLFLEIKRQWSHGARIGTIYSYFDSDDVLHLHFAERGSYLQREGALKSIPTGHLPGYFVNPQANVADSKAADAAELMVSLPAEVDANDPKWDRVIEALAALKKRKVGPYILENRDTGGTYCSETLGAGGPARRDVMVFDRKEDAAGYAQKLNEIECDGRDAWFVRCSNRTPKN